MTGFLVLNYMIGSGILNTPQAFRDSGIAATTVLYCIACELDNFLCFHLQGVTRVCLSGCRSGFLEQLQFTVPGTLL